MLRRPCSGRWSCYKCHPGFGTGCCKRNTSTGTPPLSEKKKIAPTAEHHSPPPLGYSASTRRQNELWENGVPEAKHPRCCNLAYHHAGRSSQSPCLSLQGPERGTYHRNLGFEGLWLPGLPMENVPGGRWPRFPTAPEHAT